MSSQGKKKWKWKQTLLGDVLHKGVWGRQALSKGKDQKTCRRYKRPSQGLDKSKSSSVEILKAKIPMFFTDFPEKDLHIFRRGNICFKNFHSLFDGPTCLNKHYSSIHGRPLWKVGHFVAILWFCLCETEILYNWICCFANWPLFKNLKYVSRLSS